MGVLNKLASKLIDRVLTASSVHDEDVDTTTLGKPAHDLGVPEDGDALAEVLGLRGGAAMKSPMKAMKSPMKAAKSPMKAMKAMNEYFTKMNEARKTGAKSFVYNGKPYVATKAKTGMILYKAKLEVHQVGKPRQAWSFT